MSIWGNWENINIENIPNNVNAYEYINNYIKKKKEI